MKFKNWKDTEVSFEWTGGVEGVINHSLTSFFYFVPISLCENIVNNQNVDKQ